MSDFQLPVYGDSRNRGPNFEPYVAPIHGNGDGRAGGARSAGIGPLHVLGGVNYGLAEQPRAATGVIRRADAAAVSRLPVGQSRPAWNRFSLTGIGLDWGYGNSGASGVPAGQPGPHGGSTSPGDCGCG